MDNPIQHLFCWKKHVFKRFFSYQVACNRLLWHYFGQFTVINHRHLLQNINQAKNNRKYANLFQDTVHFKQNVYDDIVHKMFEGIVGPIAGTLTVLLGLSRGPRNTFK